MNTSGLTVALALWLGLYASVAWAQEIRIPDPQQLQSMSVEEYETYREKMRNQMESNSPTERDPASEPIFTERERTEKRGTRSGYGQGYGTRNGQDGMQGRQGGYGRGGGGGGRRR